MKCRFSRPPPHFVGVEPAQVIALDCGCNTIAVALPEGNASIVIGCRFEQDVTHAAQRQVSFAFAKQRGADPSSPEFLSNVKRDDVGQGRIFLRQDKPRDVRVFHSHQAIRRAQRKKVTQRRLRVRDASREARLVKPVQRGKVPRIIGAEDRGHSQDSTPKVVGARLQPGPRAKASALRLSFRRRFSPRNLLFFHSQNVRARFSTVPQCPLFPLFRRRGL